MIRKCKADNIQEIYLIINEAAKTYDGVIPSDRYHEPYMPMAELQREMKRIAFFGWQAGDKLAGVMGIEPVKDVTLVRHAYVLPAYQKQGIGSKLLNHIVKQVTTPRLLVGMWADARWAISFYEKHGFRLLSEKDTLLKTYWDIPQRQIETSVVLGLSINHQMSR